MTGKIIQISGSVIDVQFEKGHLPRIKDALTVKHGEKTLFMEVAQHIGYSDAILIIVNGPFLLILGQQRDIPTQILGCGIGREDT